MHRHKDCTACEKACAAFEHFLKPHIVQVLVDGTVVEVVLWSDTLHASCHPTSVRCARDGGATEWPLRKEVADG